MPKGELFFVKEPAPRQKDFKRNAHIERPAKREARKDFKDSLS